MTINRRIALLLSASLVLLSGCGQQPATSDKSVASSSASQTSGSTAKSEFSTPQETAEAFVKAIAAEDLEAALDATIGEELAALFDCKSYTEKVGAFSMMNTYMPSDGGILSGTNQYRVYNQISSQINFFCVSLIRDQRIEKFTNNELLRLSEESGKADFEWFLKEVEKKPWKDLEIVYMANILEEKEDEKVKDSIKTSLTNQAKPFGADDREDWGVIYSVGDMYYLQGLSFYRYGEHWKIYWMGSSLLDLNMPGSAVPLKELDGMSAEAVKELYTTKGFKDSPYLIG